MLMRIPCYLNWSEGEFQHFSNDHFWKLSHINFSPFLTFSVFSAPAYCQSLPQGLLKRQLRHVLPKCRAQQHFYLLHNYVRRHENSDCNYHSEHTWAWRSAGTVRSGDRCAHPLRDRPGRGHSAGYWPPPSAHIWDSSGSPPRQAGPLTWKTTDGITLFFQQHNEEEILKYSRFQSS